MTPQPLAALIAGAVLALTPGAAPAAARPPAPVACPTAKVPHDPTAVESPLPTRAGDAPVIGGAKLATTGLAVPDGAPAVPDTISATSWVVADLDTGEVLGACAPHAYGAPASVQKLLLAATVLPKLNPADVITITQDDLNFEPGSSATGLILGGQYTVETLWLGLFLNSGNDCANVLARLGGGDRGVAGTVADMNAEAHRLGALETHAETPSGLDGAGQVTSAYDLALIARADFARPDFAKYDSTRSAQIPDQPQAGKKGYQIQNDNQLLYDYPGAIGGKVGFTDIARHTYVGAAQRDGRRLVATLLNGEHQPIRGWQQGAALLDWGFSVPRDASVGRLVPPGEGAPGLSAAPTPALALRVATAPGPGFGAPVTVLAVVVGVILVIGVWVGLLLLARRRANSPRP